MNHKTNIDRIVVINDYVIPRGGATTLARLAMLEFRKRGFPVTFLNGEVADAELIDAGIECQGLNLAGLLATAKLKALPQGLHNSEAAHLLAEWIDENDTPRTIYYMHNWSQIMSPAVFSPLRSVAHRTVMSCHDFFNACPNGGFFHYGKGEVCKKKPMSAECWASQCDRRGPVSKYWRMARQLNLNRLADFKTSPITFVTLHEGMSDRMREGGFNPPDLRSIRNPATAFTDEPVNPVQNRHFMFVGRLSSEKGYLTALDATAAINQPIFIAGTGPNLDMAALGREYPNAEFVGHCDRAELSRLANRSRALIVPSKWPEPFGLVIMEAIKSGLPVVVSDTCTLAEEIETRGVGRLFPGGDSKALASVLKDISENDEDVARMSKQALSAAPQLCNTTDSWVESFLDLFEEKLDQV